MQECKDNKENMSLHQKRALELYLSGATKDNDYTPLSYKEIADTLNKEGIACSKSSVGRWAVKFSFKSHLEIGLNSVVLENKEQIKESIAGDLVKKVEDETLMW